MSRLTCSQCEGMLLDAADGLLLPEEQAHFDLHLSDCQSCTRMYGDVKRGSAWMDMLKSAPPVPPAGLVDSILAKTSGNPAESSIVLANVAHAQSLFGHSQGAKVLPFRVPESKTRMARIVHTVMQPRFAMTAAMAFFSIALTMNLAGVRLNSLHARDLKPANVKKTFWSANSRVVQYYDNLRVVYELESRVREMQRDNDTENTPRRGFVADPPKEEPAKQPPAGQPRSSAPGVHRGSPYGQNQSEQPRPHLLPVEHTTSIHAAAGKKSQEGVKA